MANQLSMAKVNAILTLHASGHSQRRIAKLLGVDRETVGKYLACAAENQPNAPTGSATGPPSQCEPYRAVIEAKLQRGLSAKRIHQDLVDEHQFTAGYWSVRRFVPGCSRRLICPCGAWRLSLAKRRRSTSAAARR